MGKVKVASFAVSLDGFGAGLSQSLENPMGIGGGGLHQWFRNTKVFHEMMGSPKGVENKDNDFAKRGFENVGAWIMGRNMFDPNRGAWTNLDWKGWWGDVPPYHTPVYVLTHHPREPLVMEGGTTFYFVTDGIESALKQAKAAAKEKDIRIGGGVETVRQYLKAGWIDEMHLAYSPVYLGSGENLLSGIDLPKLGYQLAEKVLTDDAVHVVLRK